MPLPPLALTIAGSDSGGGAGIQADLKTFHALGVYGTSAITAITAQNTLGVRAVHAVPLEIVRAQIAAVAEDLPPRACKTGMLATAELVVAVADAIRDHRLPNFVLDPVMVATSGDRLLDRDAERTVLRELVPLCTLVTPNLDEAAILTGQRPSRPRELRSVAEALLEAGAGAVLVKGGHLPGDEVVDLYFDGQEERVWRRPRLATSSTHGTGCTLSAAVAAGLAHGRPLLAAVGDALDFVQRALESAPGLGAGHGPLNHFIAPVESAPPLPSGP
ncbi:MAG: bifunctional hydroxymethylpyrimidine kinase/phosphomethylpyrimidine kinase [Longimicrobiales bacterium]